MREERVISFGALMAAVFRRWKWMILCGLIFAVLAVGYRAKENAQAAGSAEADSESGTSDAAGQSESSISEDGSLYVDNNVAGRYEYMSNSIVARIDPTRESRGNVDVCVTTEALQNESPDEEASILAENSTYDYGSSETERAVVSITPAEREANDILSYYWDQIQHGMDWTEAAEALHTSPQYVQEVVTIMGNQSEFVRFNVSIITDSDEHTETILDSLTSQLENAHNAAVSEYGEHEVLFKNRSVSTVVDGHLLNWEYQRINELNNLDSVRNNFKSNLDSYVEEEESRPTELSRRSIVKYGALGFLLGIVLFMILYMLALLLSRKVLSGREFSSQYETRKLAVLPSKNTGKSATGKDAEICYEIAERNISAAQKPGARIAVLSDRGSDLTEKIRQGLQKAAEKDDSGVTYIGIGDIDSDPGELEKLKECDGAVVAAEVLKSDYTHLDEVVNTLRGFEKNFIGTISV